MSLRSSELTGSLLSRRLARGPVLNFSSLTFKLTPDTVLLENVYAGDRLGGNWLDQPVGLVDCGIL